MDRRTVLKGGLALAISGHTAVASGDIPKNSLAWLIKQHKQAIEVDKAAWNVLSDLEDVPALTGRPSLQVQVSKMLTGIDTQGEKTYRPIYAYTEEGIRKAFEGHNIWLPRPGREPTAWEAKNIEAINAAMERKLSELRTIEAERKRVEDETGYTDALTEAKRQSGIVKGLEAEIIAYVPISLREAVDKANWCVWASEDDYCYLYDCNSLSGVLSDALAAIGRASV